MTAMSETGLQEQSCASEADTTYNITRFIPVPDWNKYHPWPPPGGMRHLIFHAAVNGFSPAFKRVGRRILVDERAFWGCVERSQERGE